MPVPGTNAAEAPPPLPRPPETSPITVTKKMALQCMIAGFGLHEASHMGGIPKIDPKNEWSYLLGVLDVCHFGSTSRLGLLEPAVSLRRSYRGIISHLH